MCSIEEAWAGQDFAGHKVQSQADIHRKYMPISNDLLERNNELSVSRKEPVVREGTRGINSKFAREPRIPNISRSSSAGEAQINFSSTLPQGPFYVGLEQRPAYMSIYDNSGDNIPAAIMSGKENFNDINQAFTVSETVDRFMTHGRSMNSSNSNSLLNEDNDVDRDVFNKKIANINSEKFNNNNHNNNNNNNNDNDNDSKISMQMQQQQQQQTLQFQQALQEILHRLNRLEGEIHNSKSRNMYDMVLYILVGMLIAFIIYSILRK